MVATSATIPMLHGPEVTWLAGLIQGARQQPGGRLDIRDHTGAIVAHVQAYDAVRRPRDMPRALRPKHKLSKRQRSAAKRAKLAPPPPVHPQEL